MSTFITPRSSATLGLGIGDPVRILDGREFPAGKIVRIDTGTPRPMFWVLTSVFSEGGWYQRHELYTSAKGANPMTSDQQPVAGAPPATDDIAIPAVPNRFAAVVSAYRNRCAAEGRAPADIPAVEQQQQPSPPRPLLHVHAIDPAHAAQRDVMAAEHRLDRAMLACDVAQATVERAERELAKARERLTKTDTTAKESPT